MDSGIAKVGGTIYINPYGYQTMYIWDKVINDDIIRLSEEATWTVSNSPLKDV